MEGGRGRIYWEREREIDGMEEGGREREDILGEGGETVDEMEEIQVDMRESERERGDNERPCEGDL